LTFPSHTEQDLPLAGVRVLDLSRVLAGPMCAQYLGDLGAEVIKVEERARGDETRGWPPFRDGQGAIFLSVNRNKRSVAVDLKKAAGQEIVQRLATASDVVVENFGEPVARRLGVSYDQLRSFNPKMVYCSISGFGGEGPLADAPAYDVVLQAFTGMMTLTGDPESPPIRSPFSPIDQSTGMHAMSAILAGLFRAQRTGKGVFIEVSLFDTALGLLAYQLQTYWETGKQPVKNGSRHLSMCPYQVFETQDGPFLLAISNDEQWRRFCGAAGRPELADDERFRRNADRVARYAETAGMVQTMLGAHSRSFWLDTLMAVKVPCSPLNMLADVLADPHTRARDTIVRYAHDRLGAVNAVGVPMRFDRKARNGGTPPPLHGADTIPILRELGFEEAQIRALVEEEIVGVGDG
jgi:crotonobetainyl-CoA:carnitine CoA-transferase CaiB-like acyl-CoA transferase